MEDFPLIARVRKIFEGQFKPGYIETRVIGRHCDAFACIVTGKVEYIFQNHSFVATPENFFYLAKDSIYAIRIHEESRYICIDFDFEAGGNLPQGILFPTHSALIRKDFEQAFHLWVQKAPWYRSDAMCAVYALCSQALRSGMKHYAKTSDRFSGILDYLLQNYLDPDFSVEALADFAGITPVHLRRLFLAAVGTSPLRYMNLLRLEQAKTMLASSDYTLEMISQAVGIRDPYYLSRLFKKEVGVSPSAYRQSKQGISPLH